MTDDEESSPSSEGGGINKWWDKQGKWTKAGVIIGAGALAVGLVMYFNSQNSGGNGTSGGSILGNLTSPNSSQSQYPGSEEYFPSLPNGQGSGAGTTPQPMGTIRAATTSGPFSQYDQSNPNGVNIFNSPWAGNKVIGQEGFGSSVSLVNTTPMVINGNQWFQTTTGGYILGQDVTGAH